VESQLIYGQNRQHNIIPNNKNLTKPITHVILAFMPSSRFVQTSKESEQQQMQEQTTNEDWPLFDTVENVRGKFTKGTKVMVAIGGWGDTQGFEQAARTEESRQVFAGNVLKMVEDTGADGESFSSSSFFSRCLFSLLLSLIE